MQEIGRLLHDHLVVDPDVSSLHCTHIGYHGHLGRSPPLFKNPDVKRSRMNCTCIDLGLAHNEQKRE
jgi:hypothetical protein